MVTVCAQFPAIQLPWLSLGDGVPPHPSTNSPSTARPSSAPSPAAEAGAALSAGDSAAVLNQALDVVLDALAESPHRAELRQLLPMLVDTNAQAYRQRLAELLAPPQRTPPPAAESKDFHPPVPSSLFNKNKQPT